MGAGCHGQSLSSFLDIHPSHASADADALQSTAKRGKVQLGNISMAGMV